MYTSSNALSQHHQTPYQNKHTPSCKLVRIGIISKVNLRRQEGSFQPPGWDHRTCCEEIPLSCLNYCLESTDCWCRLEQTWPSVAAVHNSHSVNQFTTMTTRSRCSSSAAQHHSSNTVATVEYWTKKFMAFLLTILAMFYPIILMMEILESNSFIFLLEIKQNNMADFYKGLQIR